MQTAPETVVIRLGCFVIGTAQLRFGMSEQEPTNGLVACDACGVPQVNQQSANIEDHTTAACDNCGNETFTNLREPSGL
jgi:predicted sulfurtransferase